MPCSGAGNDVLWGDFFINGDGIGSDMLTGGQGSRPGSMVLFFECRKSLTE